MFDDETPDHSAGYDRSALGEDDTSTLADGTGEVDNTPLEEASPVQPVVGTVVHYKLSPGDVAMLGADGKFAEGVAKRNPVREGDTYPAMVVRVFDPTVTTANLQVFLDGDCSYWATSRQQGDQPGQWTYAGF